MILITCIDDKGGILFNHRRQSRDRTVCQDILKECADKTLYVSKYSRDLFPEKEDVNMIVSEDILRQAKRGDVCFIEDTEIFTFDEQIRKVILYRWNCRYPADFFFPLKLLEENWKLLSREEWKGSSHERITKEVYSRREVYEVL